MSADRQAGQSWKGFESVIPADPGDAKKFERALAAADALHSVTEKPPTRPRKAQKILPIEVLSMVAGEDPADADVTRPVPRAVSDREVNALLSRIDLMQHMLETGKGAERDSKGRTTYFCPSCACGNSRKKATVTTRTAPLLRKTRHPVTKEPVSFKIMRAEWFCWSCENGGDIINLADRLAGGNGEHGRWQRDHTKFQRSITRLRSWHDSLSAAGGNVFEPMDSKQRTKWMEQQARLMHIWKLSSRAIFACLADTASGNMPPRSASELFLRVVRLMNHPNRKLNQSIIYRAVNNFYKDFGEQAEAIYAMARRQKSPHDLNRERGRLVGEWLKKHSSKGRYHAQTRVVLFLYWSCFHDITPDTKRICTEVRVRIETAKKVLGLLKSTGMIWFPQIFSHSWAGWRISKSNSVGGALVRELSFLKQRGRSPPLYLRHLLFKLFGISPQMNLFGEEGRSDRQLVELALSGSLADKLKGRVRAVAAGMKLPSLNAAR